MKTKIHFRFSRTASFIVWIGGSMPSQILNDCAPWWTSMFTPLIVLQPMLSASWISFVFSGL